MHKVLSPVVDFSINFDILQYQCDRWLFKIITGAINASKASGCSPNRSLENESFSKIFWQHQNLFLIDAVHQFGFPSLFITISPYEWTKGERVPKGMFHWRTQRRLHGELICVYMSYGNFSETFLATFSENSQILHARFFYGKTCCVAIVASRVKSGVARTVQTWAVFIYFFFQK